MYNGANNQIKILIVDDTQENMEIIGNALENEGYDIYLADSGLIAIALFEKYDFDLVLLDIMMPNMDGFQTILEMRRVRPDYDVPVIFLTAKVDVDSVIRGFEIGAADYIRKPFNHLELKARVKYQVELKKMKKELEDKNYELEVAKEALKQMAITDPLTQLYNRREILARIEFERIRFERSRKCFSVVRCDIDYFQDIIDAYGQTVGDDVLKQMAALLKKTVRNQDTVGRWGGDAFIVVLPETGVEGALHLIEKLCAQIALLTISIENKAIAVTMRFGSSSFNGTQSTEALLAIADGTMDNGQKLPGEFLRSPSIK